MHTMTHTNYRRVDRITEVRRPPVKSNRPTRTQAAIIAVSCTAAAATGGTIGTLIATLVGFR